MKAVCNCHCDWFFNLHLEETIIAVCNKCRTPYRPGVGNELIELNPSDEDRYYLFQLDIDPKKLVEYWGYTIVPLPPPRSSLLDALIML